VNCDGQVNSADFLFLLQYDDYLNDGTTPNGCPDLGAIGIATAADFPWGDINCNHHLDAIDALYIVAYEAGIQMPDPSGCPAVDARLN